ncbi:MAG: hypothetical protein V4474_00390 [Patescibacteria group bacterium]
MDALGELFVFGVYVAQQMGILLGVGAETLLLCAYLIYNKQTPWGHQHATRLTRQIGLWAVILSGVGAVAVHLVAGQVSTIVAPVFLFKWVLIAMLLAFSYIESRSDHVPVLERAFIRGTGGAQWYALLLVHITAPVISWTNLLLLYAGWMIIFMLGWTGFIYAVSPKKPVQKHFVEKPQKVSVPPPPAPKPISAPLPVITHAELPKPPPPAQPPKPPVILAAPVPRPPAPPAPVAHMAAPAPKPPTYKNDAPSVPAIQVMPRTPEEIAGQNRAAVVQFN